MATSTTRSGRGRPTTKTRGNLRSVPGGKTSAPAAKKADAKPKTVSAAASSGSEVELLEALLARVTRTVDDPKCPPRDLAALTRRVQEIRKELAALKEEAERVANEDAGPAEDEAFDPAADL